MTVHRFSDEYLERCKAMSPAEIVRFLDDYRRLHGARPAPSRQVSLRVPEDLLGAFKGRARLEGVPYQTQIKRLMLKWLKEPGETE